MTGKAVYPSLWARILANTRLHPITGCWEWTGSCATSRHIGLRYPKMNLRENGRHKTVRVGRLVASIVLRRPLLEAESETVEHRCINSICVCPNEGHIVLLSNAANAASMRARKLGRDWRGEEVPLVQPGHSYWHPSEEIPF